MIPECEWAFEADSSKVRNWILLEGTLISCIWVWLVLKAFFFFLKNAENSEECLYRILAGGMSLPNLGS